MVAMGHIGSVLVVFLGILSGVRCLLVDSVSLNWENLHYSRTLDLSKGYVKETDLIEIKNVGQQAEDEYYYTLNDGFNTIGNLSLISVTINQAVVVEAKLIEDQLYLLKLPRAIAPGKSLELKVSYVYLGSLQPVPQKISMDTVQSILLKLNKFAYSPYSTHEYSLRFIGITKGQEMDIAQDDLINTELNLSPRVEEKALVYGPTLDVVPPLTIKPMGLLYDHNRPLTLVENLSRSVWVPASDVEHLSFEEYYELTNTGAQLNSGFSRVEWMKGKYEQNRNHWALSHFEIVPNNNQFNDYYFSDKVGMITTHQKIQNHLLLQPRFPIFGGWFYNFTLSWNNQLSQYIHKINNEEDVFIMKIPLLNGLRDASYNHVDLNIYLPENSQFLNVSSPIEYDDILIDHELSYLDIDKGHVKVTLKFSNLFDDMHKLDLFVTYKYTKATYLWKIFKISGFVFLGLISYFLLKKIDLSVDQQKKES